MRKLSFMVVIILVVFAGVFANGSRELTTIEGTLAVHEKIPVIETEKGSWMLPPNSFYRFAWDNEVQVGDKISVQGFVGKEPVVQRDKLAGRIMPVAVTVNGQEMDLSEYSEYPRGKFASKGPSEGGRRERKPSKRSNYNKSKNNSRSENQRRSQNGSKR